MSVIVGRSRVATTYGIVAASQPLAARAGVQVLERGGNAVDAAIAANAMQGLCEPTSCGVGGDLFAIVWDAKTKKLYGLNASGRSPYSLTLDELRKRIHDLEGRAPARPRSSGAAGAAPSNLHIPPDGPLPVNVPGCVDGWFDLHERFGRLSMQEVLAPAAQYAEDGFPVSPVIASDWEHSIKRFQDQPGFRNPAGDEAGQVGVDDGVVVVQAEPEAAVGAAGLARQFDRVLEHLFGGRRRRVEAGFLVVRLAVEVGRRLELGGIAPDLAAQRHAVAGPQ